MKKKIMLFAQLVTEIDISKYKQKEYIKIVKAIYWEIFYKKWKWGNKMPQCNKCSLEDNDKDKQGNNLFCQIEYDTFCMPCYYKEINNESEETKWVPIIDLLKKSNYLNIRR